MPRAARFNVQKVYILPTEDITTFCMKLAQISPHLPTQQELMGIYNLGGVCLQWGENWLFKRNLD
jgi:hypothetical protein